MGSGAFPGARVIIYAQLKCDRAELLSAALIQQASTCTPSGWRWVQGPCAAPPLITAALMRLKCSDSGIMIRTRGLRSAPPLRAILNRF